VRVRYRFEANLDIDRIHDYIAERNARAASTTIERIRAAANRLGSFPRIGRKGAAPGTREWKVTGLPYVIVHEVRPEADEVVILGVFHEAQLRPGQAEPSDRE
jgi:plasmid stabilization system protein ParE